MTLNGLSASRFEQRKDLLKGLDRIRRDVDASGMIEGMDAFYQRAYEIVTSRQLRDALDVSLEDPKVAESYGPDDPDVMHEYSACPRMASDLLTARRLVEAGVRCVTVGFGAWDWHDDNFNGTRKQLPYLDRGCSALLNDLKSRGLDEDVLVVAWGEFGRSPQISETAGRNHWPSASFALIAGGGTSGGQIIGATNRKGEVPTLRPVHMQDVLGVVYRHLGIDFEHTTIPDFAGRPQYLLDQPKPIPELFA